MAKVFIEEQTLTDIADAVRGKNGTTEPIRTVELATAIENLPTGGGDVADESKPVKYIDYDGTLLYSYTPEEYAELTEHPELPTREGFTYQEWNWDIVEAKDYVATYGALIVGATCITSDGKTRIHLDLTNEEWLSYGFLLAGEALIDWGDGSDTETSSNSPLVHTYPSIGKYIISIEPIGASVRAQGNVSYGGYLGGYYQDIGDYKIASRNYISNAVKAIDVGARFYFDSNYCLSYMLGLEKINFPKNSDSTQIAYQGINSCRRLKSLVLPMGITKIAAKAINNNPSLKYISLPYGLETIGVLSRAPSGSDVFLNNSALREITIPDTITEVMMGSLFSGCDSLTRIVMPHLNQAYNTTYSSYESRSWFFDCQSMEEVKIPTNATTIGQNCFARVCSLKRLEIPENITSFAFDALSANYYITNLTLPASLTEISRGTTGAKQIKWIRFKSITPPTSANSSTLNAFPTSTIFYIPKGTMEAYTTATNYPDPATYTYVEVEDDAII